MFEVVSVVLRLLVTLGLQLCPPEAKQVLLKRIFPVLLQIFIFALSDYNSFFITTMSFPPKASLSKGCQESRLYKFSAVCVNR